MTATTNFSNLNKPLLEFGRKLGISEDDWASGEDATRLVFTIPDLERERVRTLTLEPLLQLADTYGDALLCRFLHGNNPILDVRKGISREDVRAFELELRADRKLQLRLRLDKTKLLENRIGEHLDHQFVLYLFDQTLLDQLQKPVVELESVWWGDPSKRNHKAIVLTPGHTELKIDGEYLSILGGSQADGWRSVLRKQAPASDPASMYDICRSILHWQEQWLQFLTPLHFMHAPLETTDSIGDCLDVQLANLILLYTADRTVADEQSGWSATFEGERRSLQMAYGPPCLQLEPEERAGLAGLSEMVRWAYQPLKVEDRLAMVQVGMIDALYSALPEYRFRLLLIRGAGIWHDVLRFWKGFIANKIGGYSASVKAIEDDVAKTSQAYSDQISTMIKSLSATMLAAVAVVLGSFIAAIFRDPFNATIFVIGILLYTAYVIVFPLLYNMLNQHGQFKYVTASFEKRRKRYDEKLFPDVVDEIIGDQVTSSQQRFRNWYIATIAAYVSFIVIILMLMLIIVVGIPIYQSLLS